MGRVYEALDLFEKRNVAVKILHPDVADDDVSLERFKREFEVSQIVPHDHIVSVLDFKATEDGSYALVMEFLYGEELRATLKREGAIPPARLVRMLSQVAIGLDPAHSNKLVHRDLKPDNIFLCQTRDGDIVKILDFGSVKDKADNAKKLTVLGTTIGSPYYMSPEQAQGLDTLDHRADVWALGAIVYECVTGKVPFSGGNGPSILLQILTKEPEPASRAALGRKFPVPATLDAVLGRAFKKMAAMRTPSVGALADAVGGAYGLAGTHRDWAMTPEAALTAAIEAALPALMAVAPAPVSDQVGDGFFGESDALGIGDPFAAPPQEPAFDVPAGVPRAGFAWLPALLVGVTALVLGVALVLLMMR
jgi:serine/threonine-protein kinase